MRASGPRRGVVAAACTALLALALSGCDRNGTYYQFYQAVRQGAFSHHAITRSEAAAVPYASLGWRIGDGPQHLLVLATDNAGGQLWTSAEHVVFLIRDGRVVRTVGLPHDLAALAPQGGGDLLSPLAAVARPFASVRLEDFPDRPAYGVKVICSARAAGRETVTILGRAVSSLRVDETCRAESLNWSFVDSYWLDSQSGLAWKSLQHLSPDMEALSIELFRPPG